MNTIHLDLSVDETNLVLEALGQLPFVRVYALIGRIHDVARKHVERPAPNGTEQSMPAE